MSLQRIKPVVTQVRCNYHDEKTNTYPCEKMTSESHLCKSHLRQGLGLEIKESRIKDGGKGLFAHKDQTFERGDFICSYQGIILTLSPEDLEQGKRIEGDYVLQVGPDRFIDAIETTSSAGRYSNTLRPEDAHLGQNNAQLEYDEEDDLAYLVATKHINGGDEIYTDYAAPDFFD